MKKIRYFSAFAALAAGIAFSSAPVRAQMSTTAPIVVSQSAPKPVWLKAEVIHVDQVSIMVREQANSLNVHTFTFSDKVREAMQSVLDAGGFQYGDKVYIRYIPGKTEALAIHGKPSKPL